MPKKPLTEQQLREKGYVPAIDASVALLNTADQLQHEVGWVKYSLQLWFQPEPEQESTK